MQKNAIKVGKITSAKGLKGEVKIVSYTQDPLDIKTYNVFDKFGTSYVINSLQYQGKFLVAKINGVIDRNSAEKIQNLELYALRDDFPSLEEDDFYYVDLEGLKVLEDKSLKHIGNVVAVYNFGSDDILELALTENAQTVSLIFSKENFPVVSIKEGYVKVSEESLKNHLKSPKNSEE